MATPAKAGTRKTALRPRATPHSIIEAGKVPSEPLRFTSDKPEEAERVTIAYLDDYALTMPAKLPPHIALAVMRTQRKLGAEMALTEMLEKVVGEEGYSRLAEFEGLTDENLVDLFLVVQTVAMGALEGPKGRSRNG